MGWLSGIKSVHDGLVEKIGSKEPMTARMVEREARMSRFRSMSASELGDEITSLKEGLEDLHKGGPEWNRQWEDIHAATTLMRTAGR